MNKRILITFDYELFLGVKSGDPEHCLTNPTDQLLDILDSCKIKPAIFFIDTTYLIYLRKLVNQYPKAKSDYANISTQLKEILNRGHILFPHLHPHWVDAEYQPALNEWVLTNYRYYRFHNLPNPQRDDLFSNSIQILKGIQNDSGVYYPINGYRAGGWSLTPFSDFRPFFEKFGILYDFSVISRSIDHTTAQDYDYRSIYGENWYLFNDCVTRMADEGEFCEHPISTIKFTATQIIIDKFWRKIFWKLGYRSLGNGIGVAPKFTDIEEENDCSIYNSLSIENLLPSTFNLYKNYIKRHDYIHFLSHPKMVSKVNLYYFKRLLQWIQINFTVDYHHNVPKVELAEKHTLKNQPL